MIADDVNADFVWAACVHLNVRIWVCDSPTVGVLLALKEVLELREEELSARAREQQE